VCCSVLQYVAVCCSVLQCVEEACSGHLAATPTLLHLEINERLVSRLNVLQCVAVCCSVLQCVAVYCSVLQCVSVCCSALQCVAACCSGHPVAAMIPLHLEINKRLVHRFSVLQYVAIF